MGNIHQHWDLLSLSPPATKWDLIFKSANKVQLKAKITVGWSSLKLLQQDRVENVKK